MRFLFQRSHHKRYSYNEYDYSFLSLNKQFVGIFYVFVCLCFVILKIYHTVRICSVLRSYLILFPYTR